MLLHVHHMGEHIMKVRIQISNVSSQLGQMGTALDLALGEILLYMLQVPMDVFHVGTKMLQVFL